MMPYCNARVAVAHLTNENKKNLLCAFGRRNVRGETNAMIFAVIFYFSKTLQIFCQQATTGRKSQGGTFLKRIIHIFTLHLS
jgi:hypothetical protein